MSASRVLTESNLFARGLSLCKGLQDEERPEEEEEEEPNEEEDDDEPEDDELQVKGVAVRAWCKRSLSPRVVSSSNRWKSRGHFS